MPLTPADIAVLSRLLDEAQALDAVERERWLARLPPEQLQLVEPLREMLAGNEDGAGTCTAPALPRLDMADAVARPGERVGPYRLLREIGRGGMGSVWLGERADGTLKRQVALKLPRLAWDEGLAGRMARERDVDAMLEHPGIARLYDAGIDEHGRPFLALEYIDGQPIDAYVEAGALDVRARLRLFVQVVRSVAYAHGRLVVHRDLKPSNVLVTADGQAHLLDFGIAKLLDAGSHQVTLTHQHGRVMTPLYASPEQLEGGPITVQSDIYSLGVLLYELLTGRLPFQPRRGTLGAVEDAILQGDAPPASSRTADKAVAKALRGDVDAILAKAMRRSPKDRYVTADALAQDIERHLAGATVAAQPDRLGYRLGKVVRRHWMGLSALAAIVLATVAGSVATFVQAQRANAAHERERVVREFIAEMFTPGGAMDGRSAAAGPSTPQALLERGAELISSRFAGQSRLQADLYGVVSRAFTDMGAYRVASDYGIRRTQLLTVSRASDKDMAGVLLELAKNFIDDERDADALAHASRAMELGRGDDDITIRGSLLLARAQFHLGRLSVAEKLLSEVEGRLSKHERRADVRKAWAAFQRVQLMQTRNELDAAIPLMRRVVDQAEAAEGPRSLTAVEFRISFSGYLAQTDHAQLALELHREAVTRLRALGGAHGVRAAFLSAYFAWRFYSGGGNGTRAQALRSLEEARTDLGRATVSVPAWYDKQITYWIGSLKAESGDVQVGLVLMEPHVELLHQTASPFRRFHLAGVMGNALMYAGRHEAAHRWYKEELELTEALGWRDHPFAATVFHHLAENHLMQGRLDDAEAVLDKAPRFDDIRGYGGDAGRYARLLTDTRAQILLERGDPIAALKLMGPNPPPHVPLPFTEDGFDRTRTLFGELLCSVGREAEGLPLLRNWLAEDEGSEIHPHAPWLARLRAVTGLCALRMGDRKSAVTQAGLARAAFSAQPEVADFYKAPLLRLERALGREPGPK
jgi:tetratricopeptide (TPR) repeat protein